MSAAGSCFQNRASEGGCGFQQRLPGFSARATPADPTTAQVPVTVGRTGARIVRLSHVGNARCWRSGRFGCIFALSLFYASFVTAFKNRKFPFSMDIFVTFSETRAASL